ncbi:site-specific integrase [Flavobacteriaceae bacterium F89]|uniref:Site-specific integrase n=1 Tax=Cerina litoralis TaxID=2874477 RepID=A0AAE3EV38_9FLAO|nr:site-specific integrase [Cerina litoralis]MCG2461513.1 site-specific integrase [Cerina litoralis]
MENSFSVLFYPKRSDVDKHGKAPIYVRIVVGGKRSESSIQRKILRDKWNSTAGKAFGNNTEMRELNRYMDGVRSNIYKIHSRLTEKGIKFTAKDIKDIYSGKVAKSKMLLEIFQDHNDQMESLVGKEFSAGTLQRYSACKKHLEAYIAFDYNQMDMALKEIDHKFITGLEYFLKTKKSCTHNTALKYIVNFKKIIRIAYANGWIEVDPFLHWKARWNNKEREFLTQAEIDAIVGKKFLPVRLEQVKDIFLFCCYTGLAYTDVEKLSDDDIVLGMDGKPWIKTRRRKTNTKSSIPLLPPAQAILEKYANHPQVLLKQKLLPVLSNQKSNAYLKEIADICGIHKNLTTHLARHTFATTITLSNGVPIESVSKMLGHTSIKTTQHYAKVLDRKIGVDMENLMVRYARKSKSN